MGPILLASGSPDLVFFFGVLAIAAVVIGIGLASSRKREENLHACARRLGGTVTSSFWSGHRLDLAPDGVPAELTYDSGKSAFTRIDFRFMPAGSLRLVPEGFLASMRKALGAQDLEFGEPEFDNSFLVQGAPEPWVREVFNVETRRRICRLGGLGRSFWQRAELSVTAGPEGLSLICRRDLVGDRAALDTFLDDSIAFFRHLRASSLGGIQFLSAVHPGVRGHCPVCSTALDARSQRCPSCGTPHHRDCWDYFGGCAIYGCRRRGGRAA